MSLLYTLSHKNIFLFIDHPQSRVPGKKEITSPKYFCNIFCKTQAILMKFGTWFLEQIGCKIM